MINPAGKRCPSFKDWAAIVCKLLEIIDTPVALSVYLSIKYDCVYKDVPDPSNYTTAASYLDDAQAVALVRKNPWIYSTIGLADEALRKFLEAEQICKSTNDRFKRRDFTFRERSLLETARHFAGRILGPLLYDQLDFGPGATQLLAGRDANVIRKLETLPECTPLAYDAVCRSIIEHIPHYAVSCGILVRERGSLGIGTTQLPIVKGNRFTTVSKDCRADRPICIEPMGNMLVQKAVGYTIRQRLRDWGLDLNTRQDLHNDLVRIGSSVGCFATIDLSSASDTVSTEFVRFILPDDWFDFLNQIRSRYTELPDGEQLFNEKFSSMGNGFTFELESLLFYCLALSVRYHYGKRSDVISVFGDDIIVSTPLFDNLSSLLEVSGFTLNTDKSFSVGPFRESCGKDYFHGLPVRPVYIKEMPKNETERIFYMANRIREISSRRNFGSGCDISFKRVWQRILARLPRNLRLTGPAYLGDEVIRASTSEIRYRVVDGCLQVKRLHSVYRHVRIPKDKWKALSCILYGLKPNGVVPRNGSKLVKIRYAPYFYGEGDGDKWI